MEVQVVELKNDQYQNLLGQLQVLQEQNNLQMEALNMIGTSQSYLTAIVGVLTLFLVIGIGIYIVRS